MGQFQFHKPMDGGGAPVSFVRPGEKEGGVSGDRGGIAGEARGEPVGWGPDSRCPRGLKNSRFRAPPPPPGGLPQRGGSRKDRAAEAVGEAVVKKPIFNR